MLTNCDVTIYNKYIENRETKYKKSYIKNVHWEDSEGFNILQSGLTSADKSKIYIPFYSCEDYKTPIEFKKSKEGFTLKSEDVIVKGLIKDEFTTVKDLEKNHDYVRLITTVDVRDYGSENMKHFEVGGK